MPNNKQSGFLHLPNDNMVKTIAVALVLCLVCSVIVSTAATLLKPQQQVNKLLDRKRNILLVAGLLEEGNATQQQVDRLFAQIETRLVDLNTGDYSNDYAADTYDQRKASKDPQSSTELDASLDLAQIKRRADIAPVYLLKRNGVLEKIILPIKGYGLWSTMYGFLALQADANTVSGITFYEHGETPGLGGEIENKKWQQQWQNKRLFNQQGQAVLRLVKGVVDPSAAQAAHQIDGLAGATLTSNGVSNLIQFWVGANGFGPYLQNLQSQAVSAAGG